MNKENNRLGQKIKQLRISKGLTQEELAEQIGIDNKHLSRIENGRHLPTFNIIKKLVTILDFDIYGFDVNPEKEIEIPDKIYMKSLRILNSAKNEQEKKYYLEALILAQKGLKLGRKN